MSGRASRILAVLVTVVLVGTMVLFGRWRRDERLETGVGALHEAKLVQGDAPVLLSIESLEFSSEDSDEIVYRMTAWDALTGQRITRVKEVPWRHCASASKGLVWCTTEKDELEVLSVPALTVKFDAAAVSAKAGQKIMNATTLEVTETGKLRVTLADGHKVELDAETLSSTPQVPDRERPSSPSPRVFDCGIPNSERRGLCERVNYGNERRVDTGDGWLRLQVVCELPDGWILAANSSLDEAANVRRVLKIDSNFQEVGSTVIGKMAGWVTFQPMWAKPNELFLISSSEAGVTVGIDAKNAKEAFRISH